MAKDKLEKIKEIIPTAILVVSLALGATACQSSDHNPNGFDPNTDQESQAPVTVPAQTLY